MTRPTSSIPPYIWAGIGGTTAIFGCCYYAFLDEAPVTKRRRWIATSPEWERQLGDREYQQLLRQYRGKILTSDHPASKTVHRVGRRIADASVNLAQKYNLPSAPPYTYTIVRSDQANAFVLPGNHVFVLTGLFQYVRDEDDLAAVLGHEVAHTLCRHAGEKVSGSLAVNLLARLSLLIDPSGLILTFLLPAATVFRELPNSRVQETEADQIGLQLAAQACYDPRAAKRVFARMSGEGAPPEFLSTHPSHHTRLTKLDEWMPEARRLMEDGDRCRRIRESMKVARQEAARRL